MKTVKIHIQNLPYREVEVDIPEGCYKEKVYDYQDPEGYYRWYYTSKKGKKKLCNVVLV